MIDRILRLEAASRLRPHGHRRGARRPIVIGFPDFQENGQFIGSEKYERVPPGQRHHAGALRGERARGPAAPEVLRPRQGFRRRPGRGPPARVLRPQRQGDDRVHHVPASRLESAAPATDADLKAYLEKHKDRYRTPAAAANQVPARRPRQGPREGQDPRRRDPRPITRGGAGSFQVPEQVAASHILIKVDPEKGPAADAEAKEKAEALLARVQKAARTSPSSPTKTRTTRAERRTADSSPPSAAGRWSRSSSRRPST